MSDPENATVTDGLFAIARALEGLTIALTQPQRWIASEPTEVSGAERDALLRSLRDRQPTILPDDPPTPIWRCDCGHDNIDHDFRGEQRFRGSCGHVDCPCPQPFYGLHNQRSR